MKKCIFSLSILLVVALVSVFAKDVTAPADLPTYYSGVNGKSGDALFSAVHDVTLVGYGSLGYNGLWEAFKTTDVYPAGHPKEGYIWDMYSNCSFTQQCGSYSKECDCYNREHSIPQSWWGEGTSNQGCDIFHLVPTDGVVNGMRSNYAFGEVGSETKVSGNGSKLGSGNTISITNTIAGDAIEAAGPSVVFEPIDDYKGDFARGYFGTLLHWTNVQMTQDHGDEVFSGVNTKAGLYGLTEYGVALLMKWHRQDPVSQKEIDRNNGIQATQGNRNPFIDYPDLAEYIWGNHAEEVFMLSAATATFADDYEPGTGGGGTITPPEPVELKLYRNGDIETIDEWDIYDNLPTDENDACDDDEWLFAGWSASNVSVTTAKPDFITKVSEAGIVYAVYVKTETSGEGVATTTITMADYEAVSGTFDKFNFEAAKNTGSTNPTYNANYKDARIYAKGSLTISCENEMNQIVFNLSAQGLKRLAPITASVGEIAAQASGDETVTWTGAAKEVTFTVGDQADYGSDGSTKAGQLCFTSVYITAGGGTTTTTYASQVACASSCEGQLATPAVMAVPGDKQITLTWADVENADHYEVAVSAGVGFTTECGSTTIGDIVKDGATNTCVITGLVNGLEYTTTVRAIGTSVCDSEAATDTATPTDVVIPTATLTFIIGGESFELPGIPYGTPMEAVIAEVLKQYGATYSDNCKTYTYDGLEGDIPETVTGDATYTVMYTSEDRLFTITFKYMNEFGEQIEKAVSGKKCGDVISLDSYWPNDGYRDETYTYYILGWLKNGEGERIELDAKYTVDGDAELVWDYEKVLWYPITFYDEDGTTILQVAKCDEDALPSFTNPTPAKEGQVFAGWTPMPVLATGPTSYTATYAEAEPQGDALDGAFSVSASKKVRFAKGNLMYNIANEEWSLATTQYDIIGAPNLNLGSADFTGTIDMFGWSTTSTNYGVNPSNADDTYTGDFRDWGQLIGEEWFTLSKDEWSYVYSRKGANGKKLWGSAIVVDRKGLILLPDNWQAPEGIEFVQEYRVDGDYTFLDFEHNKFTFEEWQKMEEAGAVFLPAAGRRTGGIGNTMNGTEEATFVNPATGYYSWMDNVDVYGYYWTSTPHATKEERAHYLIFNGHSYYQLPGIWPCEKRRGQAVRLVKEAIYSIEVIAGEHGQAMGSGDYAYGETATLTATPDEHYLFIGWSDGETEAVREIVVNKDLTVTALFKPEQFTITASGENGTVEGAGTYDYGTEIQLTATGNKGYTFEAWNDGDTNNPRTITVTTDATYIAIFAVVPYTITKNVEGQGSITGPDGGNLNDVVTLTAVPAEGWNFKAWENGSEEAERQITINGDVEVTATFEIQMFEVTFNVGKVSETKTLPYGTPYNELIAAAMVQYGFELVDGVYTLTEPCCIHTLTGWKEVDELPELVTANATFTAEFTTVTRLYDITWVVDGNEITEQVAWGEKPEAPEVSGYQTAEKVYTFAGWDKEIVAVAGDATYTAKFDESARLYTITFVVGPVNYPIEGVPYGTEMAVIFSDFDGVLEQYGVTKNEQGQYQYSDTKYLYTFTGWDKDVPETVSGDATYTAQFSKTELDPPTGVEEHNGVTSAVKVYEKGVLYILRNGKKYTAYGALVE